MKGGGVLVPPLQAHPGGWSCHSRSGPQWRQVTWESAVKSGDFVPTRVLRREATCQGLTEQRPGKLWESSWGAVDQGQLSVPDTQRVSWSVSGPGVFRERNKKDSLLRKTPCPHIVCFFRICFPPGALPPQNSSQVRDPRSATPLQGRGKQEAECGEPGLYKIPFQNDKGPC